MAMMVCIKPFVHRDRYGEHRFVPGRSYAADDTAYVRWHLHCWAPVTDERSRTRARTLTRYTPSGATCARRPGRALGLEAWRLADPRAACRHSWQPSDVRVRLSRSARRAILDELDQWSDQVETGGTLWGTADRMMVECLHAVSGGPGAQRTSTSFAFDLERNGQIEQRMRAEGHARIGEFHGHPDAVITPSPADLELFDSARRRAGVENYLGIIATPSEQGWQLHPWVIGDGLCRPVRIT